MRYVIIHTKMVYAKSASMTNMTMNAWIATRINASSRGGLCKGCYESFFDKYDNKLCMDCNKNKCKFKGGLCKGYYMKNRNDIITKKCIDCNTNQAKCKGGLCKGCYKKQGCDST